MGSRIGHPGRRAGGRAFHRSILIAAVLGVLVPATLAAEPSATIVVDGNRRIDAEAIRSHFPARGELDAAVLDAALKELYATGVFEDVQITRSGGKVIVHVVEAPVIGRLQFEGNKQIKDADLTKEIGLKPQSA